MSGRKAAISWVKYSFKAGDWADSGTPLIFMLFLLELSSRSVSLSFIQSMSFAFSPCASTRLLKDVVNYVSDSFPHRRQFRCEVVHYFDNIRVYGTLKG